jgi:phasin family protein
MARKSPAATAPAPARKPRAKARRKAAPKAAPKAKPASRPAAAMPDFGASMAAMRDMAKMGKMQMGKMPELMSPEQAMEMYKANAKMALDVINAAIEGTAKMRKLQYEGEEQARAFGKKHARSAAEAGTPNALMAAGQGAAQEAVEHAMAYWSQMFELITEMQKRLFTLMEGQMAGVPGVKEAKAAMSMMPDLSQAQNVVKAMQGLVTSGGSAFEQMQKVMGDMSRMAGGFPGMRR